MRIAWLIAAALVAAIPALAHFTLHSLIVPLVALPGSHRGLLGRVAAAASSSLLMLRLLPRHG